jgi:hypothetical protein
VRSGEHAHVRSTRRANLGPRELAYLRAFD